MVDVISLTTKAGSSVVINLYGATVTSYSANGKEVLMLSSQSKMDGSKAIRGGIPLVFPCFGPWSLGPQHGFARISVWTHKGTQNLDTGSVEAQFELKNNADTEKMWPHKFTLLYTVTLSDECLKTSLSVTNDGDSEFDFTTLLHTYFRVDDIQSTVVTGLSGLQYTDKLKDGEKFTEVRSDVDVEGGADSVYQSTPDSHIIKDKSSTTTYTLYKSGLPDTVVWNPWEKAKNMSDFGDEEYKNMICVEAGAVTQPVKLKSGETKIFSQTIKPA